MPVINIPTVVSVDQRQKLFLINTDNMPSFSEINHSVEVVALEIPTEAATAPKVKRAYEKKVAIWPLKRSKRQKGAYLSPFRHKCHK